MSSARMALRDVAPDPRLELLDRPGVRPTLREHRAMDILGRVATRPANDDRPSLDVPLEHGAGSDAQAAADLGGDRHLPLGGQLRLRNRRHGKRCRQGRGRDGRSGGNQTYGDQAKYGDQPKCGDQPKLRFRKWHCKSSTSRLHGYLVSTWILSSGHEGIQDIALGDGQQDIGRVVRGIPSPASGEALVLSCPGWRHCAVEIAAGSDFNLDPVAPVFLSAVERAIGANKRVVSTRIAGIHSSNANANC